MEVIQGIFSEAFWYIAPILVTATTFLAGLINQGLARVCNMPGWAKQLVSWGVGAGLSCAAWGLGVITFGNPVWLGVVALCVVVGLSSNGIYDISFIKNWIEKWFVPVTAVVFAEKEVEANRDANQIDDGHESKTEPKAVSDKNDVKLKAKAKTSKVKKPAKKAEEPKEDVKEVVFKK